MVFYSNHSMVKGKGFVMTLSAMIRKGALVHPKQSFDALIITNSDSTIYATCALAAAYIGLTDETTFTNTNSAYRSVYDLLRQTFPELRDNDYWLENEIIGKNDREGLSREAIADWLESIGY